jgi:hypothetical protein
MKQRVRSKIRQYGRILAGGNVRPIFEDLSRWAWSHDRAVGMERDLTLSFEPPAARVPIEVVRLDNAHAVRLFSEEGLDTSSVLDMESRRRFWEDGIPDAYVAIDEEGIPCFVQWAIPGEHAELVKSYFGDGFPELRPDEMLLEGAWARPEARGKRIMAEAMSRITLAGARPQHRRAITFVGVDNEPSIRGCRAAGYEVYIGREETWRFGRRKVIWGNPTP